MITIKIDKALNVNNDYSMFLSFPYNADIIDIIHALPVRYWLKESKEWEVPLKQLNTLIEKFAKLLHNK